MDGDGNEMGQSVRQGQGLKCLKWLGEFVTIPGYPSETLTHDSDSYIV